MAQLTDDCFAFNGPLLRIKSIDRDASFVLLDQALKTRPSK